MKIKEQVQVLTERIETFEGCEINNIYLDLEETLTRHLLSLDGIEPEGDASIRIHRGQCIDFVLKCISLLESKVLMPDTATPPNVSNIRTSEFGRVNKFKHMKGTPMHKSMHFENLKNLCKSVPADCDVIQVNAERVVVPLAGPGGKLAVFELAKSGRIPDGVVPAVINTATVMDFAWDPFRNSRLAVVTDDGALNIWDIPEGGLYSQVNEPAVRIQAHGEKVNTVKFNPVASDIVATSGFDWLIKIWNLSENCKEVAVLEVRKP